MSETNGTGSIPDLDTATMRAHLDAFVNAVTGLGGQFTDKTRGGLVGGPQWSLTPVGYQEANNLYRGSDLGRTIIDKPVEEMIRRGWDVEVQPTEEEQTSPTLATPMDTALAAPRQAAAGWRRIASHLDGAARKASLERARRWDEVAAGTLPAESAPAPPPGPLPQINQEGADVGSAIETWAARIPNNVNGRGATAAIAQALRYERAFGGGCVFIGVDDGGRPLTEPLDPAKVRKVTHLTALRGGVDGVVTMWRPYRFATEKKFGLPEIFQVTNSSVPIAAVPAPGENLPPEVYPASPTGPTLFYVHESRFLIFDGDPTSTETRQDMKGWGDSIFTRVKDPLLQFEQGWQAVGILMQEASIVSVGMEGFTRALAEKGVAARDQFIMLAQLQSLMRSVSRTNYYDKGSEFKRDAVAFAGIAELLDRQVDRIAAASGMPVSVLFGNLKGGLGAKEDPSSRTWNATIEAKQESRLRDPLEYLYRLGFKSKEGPTRGVEPDKWTVIFRPLAALGELEMADLRSKTSTADDLDIKNQIVTPAEVAATRYGGAEYNAGPIVIDMESRTKASAMQPPAPPVPAPGEPAPDDGEPLNGAAKPGRPPLPDGPGFTSPIPPIRMMATDPWTGTPASTPSGAGDTGGRGDGWEYGWTADARIDKGPEHAPAGSPEGGQFTSQGGSGSAGGAKQATKWSAVKTTPAAPGTKAAPGSQLEPHVLARLKELGARLPPAHIAEVHVSEHLNDPVKAHEGAVVKWQTVSKTGKATGVVGVSKQQQNASHERIFARTEEQRPQMEGKQRELESKAATSPPHAAAALIAETGLRRGSDDNEPGHFGALTMEARHVTISGGKAHIEYVGKEGVVNKATIDKPAIVHALQAATAGKGPHDPVWPKSVNEKSVQSTLLPGQKIKDLRTIAGTKVAEHELSKITPTLTGNDKKDARAIGAIVKQVSTTVSQKLNNKPAQSLESYIAPSVFRAWGEKHGIKAEWLK